MSKLNFEWDESKNLKNINKHGVSFEEAKTVFYSENAVLFDDPDHSYEENRFILMGFSFEGKFLVVCHCERDQGSTIRIISARKATKKEKKDFNTRW